MSEALTLASIEKHGAERLKNVLEELRGCYLERYGIHNPWTAWIIRTDARFVEKRGCAWADDYLIDESDYGEACR